MRMWWARDPADVVVRIKMQYVYLVPLRSNFEGHRHAQR